MGICSATWEDEECNRMVELSVEYRLDGDRLELLTVTPESVTFVDPQTKAPLRTIKIWRDTARSILFQAYCNKVGLEQLEREVNESLLAGA